MKVIPFLFVGLLWACDGDPDTEPIVPPTVTQPAPELQPSVSVEYSSGNQHDYKGRKQGYWILYGKDYPSKGYPAEAKVEEGNYTDDQKDGEWIYFNPASEIDST